MPLPDACDLELSPGDFCNQPVTHIALSATAPEMWLGREDANACLAGFCSPEHANAEPRPTLAAAKHAHATVADMCDEQPVLDAWQRAIVAYPAPVELHENAPAN
ncbi:hypothetical protein ACFO3J_24280 [Streptomyces polygonati]|uniref:Uncharacterized protein n=1 Tax=Streptomyces polygonati TaxID=1617087 RepID=A0ABV8HUS7_9ACTN